MGEHIVDNFKREAMKVPFLRDLLLSDSIYISSNITFDNLEPLSTYLGKPGNPAKGGIPFAEYQKRQDQHREAEIAALLDVPHLHRARRATSTVTSNFVCDSGGSLCEVVDPDDPARSGADAASPRTRSCSTSRARPNMPRDAGRALPPRSPSPCITSPQFLKQKWAEYKAVNRHRRR